MDLIYLDHNATAPLLPEVAEAMARCQRDGFANPSSQHRAGRRARQLLEDAREVIAAILGANLSSRQPDQLIFTSGGTEANNLALFGLAHGHPGRVVVSPLEHPSVLTAAEQLARRGWQLDRAAVRADGVVDLDDFRARLTEPSAPDRAPARLAALMLASHETGVVQPVAELAETCRAAAVPLHCDAVQVAGKLPIDFARLGVTTLSVAAHKFHGPRGIGALVVRHGTRLEPQLFGGFQEGGLRPGTESVSLAVGMRAALELWQREQEHRVERLAALRDQLEAALLAAWPEAIVNGRAALRLPHVVNIAFVGLDRQALVMALDLAGVACSTGSACASGSTDPSPALVAMGVSEAVWNSSLRFSLGAGTTAAEVAQACERILRALNELKNRIRGGKIAGTGRLTTPSPV